MDTAASVPWLQLLWQPLQYSLLSFSDQGRSCLSHLIPTNGSLVQSLILNLDALKAATRASHSDSKCGGQRNSFEDLEF